MLNDMTKDLFMLCLIVCQNNKLILNYWTKGIIMLMTLKRDWSL